MELLQQEITSFTSSNITESVLPWNASILTAGAFIVGVSYTIVSVGTTNFTLIGAASNTIGVIFTATGVGTGTGTAQTTYKVGEFSLLGTFIYKSVSNNVNKSPATTTGVYWVKYSISNKWAMLDLSAQSRSYLVGGNLTVEFLQNRMSTLAIGNYEAEYVTVEILDTDGTTVLWTFTSDSTINAGVIDWWTYLYEPYEYQIDKGIRVPLGLFGYKIRVTFYKSAASTQSACGYLVGGSAYSMGETLSNVNFKFNSFASKTTDDFGTLTVTKRAVQDIVDFETIIQNTEVSRIRRKIKEFYNDIIVFIVDESDTSIHENLLTLGVVESAAVVLTEFDQTTLTWSVIESI